MCEGLSKERCSSCVKGCAKESVPTPFRVERREVFQLYEGLSREVCSNSMKG